VRDQRRLNDLETATDDLPVFPNGYAYHMDCTCRVSDLGRTMIYGRWVKVCMQCGSLRQLKRKTECE